MRQGDDDLVAISLVSCDLPLNKKQQERFHLVSILLLYCIQFPLGKVHNLSLLLPVFSYKVLAYIYSGRLWRNVSLLVLYYTAFFKQILSISSPFKDSFSRSSFVISQRSSLLSVISFFVLSNNACI